MLKWQTEKQRQTKLIYAVDLRNKLILRDVWDNYVNVKRTFFPFISGAFSKKSELSFLYLTCQVRYYSQLKNLSRKIIPVGKYIFL